VELLAAVRGAEAAQGLLAHEAAAHKLPLRLKPGLLRLERLARVLGLAHVPALGLAHVRGLAHLALRLVHRLVHRLTVSLGCLARRFRLARLKRLVRLPGHALRSTCECAQGRLAHELALRLKLVLGLRAAEIRLLAHELLLSVALSGHLPREAFGSRSLGLALLIVLAHDILLMVLS
jgi:hypothetical protein